MKKFSTYSEWSDWFSENHPELLDPISRIVTIEIDIDLHPLASDEEVEEALIREIKAKNFSVRY